MRLARLELDKRAMTSVIHERLRVGNRSCGLILDQPEERTIGVDYGSNAPAPVFEFWRMKARLAVTAFRQASHPTGLIKGVKVVQPQATTEPTLLRIELRVREELQHEVASL